MKTSKWWSRIPAVLIAAFLGGASGAMLAAFGNLIGSSPLGVIIAVVVGGWIGLMAGGQPAGAVVGAICGVMCSAFGSLIGGTPLAVTITISACALLSGWIEWCRHEPSDSDGLRQTVDRGAPAKRPWLRFTLIDIPLLRRIRREY